MRSGGVASADGEAVRGCWAGTGVVAGRAAVSVRGAGGGAAAR
ncbi:hypothetical protein [Streptomyces sp. HUAS ZL42]